VNNSEKGTGTTSIIFGVVMFLGCILLTVQLCVTLMTKMRVEATAHDVVRRASRTDENTYEQIKDKGYLQLGNLKNQKIEISNINNELNVTVSAQAPSMLPQIFNGELTSRDIEVKKKQSAEILKIEQ
jgi:Flp pilus assembly protein TadG